MNLKSERGDFVRKLAGESPESCWFRCRRSAGATPLLRLRPSPGLPAPAAARFRFHREVSNKVENKMVSKWTQIGLAAALALLSVGALRAADASTGTGTGTITGSVVTAKGNPVAGATVLVLSRFPLDGSTKFTAFDATVTTAKDGTFSVTGVPSGRFAVCPALDGSRYLPPCMWSSEPVVVLSEGQSAKTGAITMSEGVDLYVRVDDTKSSRSSKEGRQAGASLMLGVKAPNGVVFPIPQAATDKGGADHHLVVPVETDLTVVAFSQEFDLADSNGADIDKKKGYQSAFRIKSDQSQHKETLKIK
jgi:hypothetical protein